MFLKNLCHAVIYFRTCSEEADRVHFAGTVDNATVRALQVQRPSVKRLRDIIKKTNKELAKMNDVDKTALESYQVE